MTGTEAETPFGDALFGGLREAIAWKRGEVALPAPNAPSLTAERVKAIRERASRRPRENFPAASASRSVLWKAGSKADANPG
jgi:hypothetical protein